MSQAINILLSNDDGVNAPGLRAAFDVLCELGECQVVAPDGDRSGTSSSLTLDRPLYPEVCERGFVRINGTPTDCVHLALNGLLTSPIDVVVSGINLGANLGDDILYSGTVAAALEGRFQRLPAVAISLCSRDPAYLPTAQWVLEEVLSKLPSIGLPARSILNINVPACTVDEVKGFKLSRLGHRQRAKSALEIEDPRGRRAFWIAGVGPVEDGAEDTDFAAIAENFVSITPLQIDKTDYQSFAVIEQWLKQ